MSELATGNEKTLESLFHEWADNSYCAPVSGVITTGDDGINFTLQKDNALLTFEVSGNTATLVRITKVPQ